MKAAPGRLGLIPSENYRRSGTRGALRHADVLCFLAFFAASDIELDALTLVAEGEALTLADVLVDRIRGGSTINPYVGEIKCYIEMGHDRAGLVDVNFLSGPAPTALAARRRMRTDRAHRLAD